jgi:hypothetical protein
MRPTRQSVMKTARPIVAIPNGTANRGCGGGAFAAPAP